jgi:tetratricopeptide (TPR) repeat protein
MWKWVVIALLWSATALAQPDHSAALFEDGRALAEQGKYAEACDRFERSYALDAAAGTELNIGDCQEHLGHLAEAWRRFADAAARFEIARDERTAFARSRRDALAPRLGSVIVKLADPSVNVTIDGRAQPPGTQLNERVDPGDVVIRAGDITRNAEVAAGATVVVDLLPHAQPGDARRRRIVIASVVGGAGVVTGAVALGLALKARSDYDNELSNGDCTKLGGASMCNATGVQRQRDAIRLAQVGTGLAIGGIGAILAGAVIYMTAPSSSVVIAPTASTDGAGLVVVGSF